MTKRTRLGLGLIAGLLLACHDAADKRDAGADGPMDGASGHEDSGVEDHDAAADPVPNDDTSTDDIEPSDDPPPEPPLWPDAARLRATLDDFAAISGAGASERPDTVFSREHWWQALTSVYLLAEVAAQHLWGDAGRLAGGLVRAAAPELLSASARHPRGVRADAG